MHILKGVWVQVDGIAKRLGGGDFCAFLLHLNKSFKPYSNHTVETIHDDYLDVVGEIRTLTVAAAAPQHCKTLWFVCDIY